MQHAASEGLSLPPAGGNSNGITELRTADWLPFTKRMIEKALVIRRMSDQLVSDDLSRQDTSDLGVTLDALAETLADGLAQLEKKLDPSLRDG